MLAIKNANIVLENKIIPNGVLLISDGKIANFSSAEDIEIPKGCEVFDAQGNFVGPGFVDIHCHGGNGYNLCENPTKAAEHFLSHGETTVLATFYTTTDKDSFLKQIKNLKAEKAKNNASKIIPGFYMEGPYMNPKYGASPELNRWCGEIKPENYKELVDELGPLALVWAIAPEREGVADFLAYAKKVNPRAVISIGHSEATPEDVAKLDKFGITLLTHCTNATARIPRSDGTRSCGPDEICFLNPNMYAEVISDSLAIHVQPEMQQLILQIKGIDKVVLISDSFVSNEPIPKEYEHITDLSFDASGGLSGSKLTLDAACRNVMAHTGCSMCEAFIMASRNPARVIGMDDKIGTICVEKKANLVIVDKDFNIKNVIFEGEFIC